jgi:hypothetical protein
MLIALAACWLKSTAPAPQDGGTHPIWAAGLTGAGQVIGGGDSGVGETSIPLGN